MNELIKNCFKRQFVKNIAGLLAVYIAIFGIYYLLGQGLSGKGLYLEMRRFFVLSILLMLPYYITKQTFFRLEYGGAAFVSLAWLLTYPLFYYLTYRNSVIEISSHFDMVYGICLFVVLTIVQLFLYLFFGRRRLISLLLAVVQFVMLIVPAMQWVYFGIYGEAISEAALMAIYQTNISEAIEFVTASLGMTGIIGTAGLLLLIFAVFYRLERIAHQPEAVVVSRKKVSLMVLFIACPLVWYMSGNLYRHLPLSENYYEVKRYFAENALYSAKRQARLEKLTVEPPAVKSAKPGTVILVIGESASRSYMSAFSDTERNTTPWLKQQQSDKDFVLFKHAYTSKVQTVPALENALTEKNQYNDRRFNESCSIIDIAQKAGYKTSWFSNQGTIGSADTAVTLVAQTADLAEWTNQDLTRQQYDGALLEKLKQVDPTVQNFVILHLMGSHDNYMNRYPEQYTKWGTPNVYNFSDNYDCSLYYTDYVLSEIYKYASANLNLQAMVYVSDHGAKVGKPRRADEEDFIAARVPLFVYLSKEYQQSYPETAQALRSNADKCFTNDLIYEMMCGIFQIKSEHYDETQSIASPKYRYRREDLKTMLGTKSLSLDTADIELEQQGK